MIDILSWKDALLCMIYRWLVIFFLFLYQLQKYRFIALSDSLKVFEWMLNLSRVFLALIVNEWVSEQVSNIVSSFELLLMRVCENQAESTLFVFFCSLERLTVRYPVTFEVWNVNKNNFSAFCLSVCMSISPSDRIFNDRKGVFLSLPFFLIWLTCKKVRNLIFFSLQQKVLKMTLCIRYNNDDNDDDDTLLSKAIFISLLRTLLLFSLNEDKCDFDQVFEHKIPFCWSVSWSIDDEVFMFL